MRQQTQCFYEFGPFRMDAAKRLLWRDGGVISLTPKTFDVLLALVESAGTVVEKDELMRPVWPDSFVEESNLAYHISLLRKALSESRSQPNYIVTISGRGYRFVADVQELQAENARLNMQPHPGLSLPIEEEIETGAQNGVATQSEMSLAFRQNKIAGLADSNQEPVSETDRESSLLPNARNEQAVVESVQEPATSTEEKEDKEARAKSSAGYLVSELKRHKRGLTLTLAVLIITAAGIAFVIHNLTSRNLQTAPFQAMKIAKLTTSSNIGGLGPYAAVAISPDGKYVAHVIDDEGKQSLWVKQVSGGGSQLILPPAEVEYLSLAFSNDGNDLYYLSFEKGKRNSLCQVPVLGGASRKLIERLSEFALSPDNKHFAFVRRVFETRESQVIVVNLDGTGEQVLATRKRPEVWGPLAWSPDGKTIAAVSASNVGGGHSNMIVVQVKDGMEKLIPSPRWADIRGLAWLADGHSLVLVAREQMSESAQIWQLSYPIGEALRITNDLNDYSGLSLTADSTTLVTVRKEQLFNIWIAPHGEASRAKQITSDNYSGRSGFSWTPEGRLVYASTATGQSHLWIMDADGSRKRPLTVGDHCNARPTVSPDGRFIVFWSNRTLTENLWRMDIDGDNLKRLTFRNIDNGPQCTPDGQWVIYASFAPDRMTLWKVPIDGGEPVHLVEEYSLIPRLSPDGKLLAYLNFTPPDYRVTVTPLENTESKKIVDLYKIFNFEAQLYGWMPDSRALAYIRTQNGVSNLWSQPIDGSPPKQLTDFKADRIFSFEWSRDGKQLALSRGTVSRDVVMIKDFR